MYDLPMNKLVYYTAVSLDGFIADSQDSVSWLDAYQEQSDSPYQYEKIYPTFSGMIMGRVTFDFIKDYVEKNKVDYPHKGKPTLVFTNNSTITNPFSDVQIVGQDYLKVFQKFQQKYPGTIWLVGGGKIATWFLEHNLIDEMILTQIPITLGDGKPLFSKNFKTTKWNLVDSVKNQKTIQFKFINLRQ